MRTTEMELVRGCRNAREMRHLRRFLDGAFGETVQVTEEISRRALSLVGRHARSGLEPVDALIAATALTVRAGLLTGNGKHFRPISGLRLIPFRVT